jgi:hypothetical protein
MKPPPSPMARSEGGPGIRSDTDSLYQSQRQTRPGARPQQPQARPRRAAADLARAGAGLDAGTLTELAELLLDLEDAIRESTGGRQTELRRLQSSAAACPIDLTSFVDALKTALQETPDRGQEETR